MRNAPSETTALLSELGSDEGLATRAEAVLSYGLGLAFAFCAFSMAWRR